MKNGARARHDGPLAEMVIVMQLLLLLPAQFSARSYFHTPTDPANRCYFFNSTGVDLGPVYFPCKRLTMET